MKKLIIIFMFPFVLNAQENFKNFFDFSILKESDKQVHFAFSAFNSLVIHEATYYLIKDSRLKVWQSKLIAKLVGTSGSILIGCVKELRDKKRGGIFNKKDLIADCHGAIAINLPLLILRFRTIPESKIPDNTIHYALENEFLNTR